MRERLVTWPTAPLKSRADVTGWLEQCVLGDLRTLRVGIEAYHAADRKASLDGRPLGGGNFLLAGGCCLAMRYFGALLNSGTTDADHVEAYCERFLVLADPRYAQVGGLLWRCFRDGIVHGGWPKAIYPEGQPECRIVSGVGTGRGGLHLAPDHSIERPTFIVSAHQLLADLECSYDRGFRRWLLEESDDGVVNRANPEPFPIPTGSKKLREQFDLVCSWRDGAK